MQLPTLQFFFFFIAVMAIASFLKKYPRIFKYFLLLVSILFYSSFGTTFLGILIADILANYLLQLAGVKYPKHRKKIFVATIIVNILFLGLFKYYNFFTNILLETLSRLNIPANLSILDILAPVGVSFFTFRIISHAVDLQKNIIKLPSLIDYANYVMFFPQISAGPIARARDFYVNLANPTTVKYSTGRIASLILSGLLKKIVIASFLYDITAGPFSTPENYSSYDLIISALAYAMMIYTDFSGYSDLSIAVANILGFYVPDNFNYPYRAVGLKDFWDRWHISLSAWLRDYIYIPLGGNRKGKIRKYINLMLTMLISGFWHGAGVNFIIWGGLHGIGTIFTHLFEEFITKVYFKFNHKLRLVLEKLKFIFYTLGWAMTFGFVTLGWIFFNTANYQTAYTFIRGIFKSGIEVSQFVSWKVIFVIVLVLFMNFFGRFFKNHFIKIYNNVGFWWRVLIMVVLTYVILNLGPETVPPFIYFNF